MWLKFAQQTAPEGGPSCLKLPESTPATPSPSLFSTRVPLSALQHP